MRKNLLTLYISKKLNHPVFGFVMFVFSHKAAKLIKIKTISFARFGTALNYFVIGWKRELLPCDGTYC